MRRQVVYPLAAVAVLAAAAFGLDVGALAAPISFGLGVAVAFAVLLGAHTFAERLLPALILSGVVATMWRGTAAALRRSVSTFLGTPGHVTLVIAFSAVVALAIVLLLVAPRLGTTRAAPPRRTARARARVIEPVRSLPLRAPEVDDEVDLFGERQS